MRSFGGYCRIATALGDISLRYAHNVRETFRNARLERAQGVNREPFCNGALRRRAVHALIAKAPHCPPIRNRVDTGFLSMGEMLGLVFGATAASETLCALRRSYAPNASLQDFSENVRARSCFAFVTVQW